MFSLLAATYLSGFLSHSLFARLIPRLGLGVRGFGVSIHLPPLWGFRCWCAVRTLQTVLFKQALRKTETIEILELIPSLIRSRVLFRRACEAKQLPLSTRRDE